MSTYGKIEILDDFFKILISEKRENNVKLVGKKNHERKREKNRKKTKKEDREKENGPAQFWACCVNFQLFGAACGK